MMPCKRYELLHPINRVQAAHANTTQPLIPLSQLPRPIYRVQQSPRCTHHSTHPRPARVPTSYPPASAHQPTPTAAPSHSSWLPGAATLLGSAVAAAVACRGPALTRPPVPLLAVAVGTAAWVAHRSCLWRSGLVVLTTRRLDQVRGMLCCSTLLMPATWGKDANCGLPGTALACPLPTDALPNFNHRPYPSSTLHPQATTPLRTCWASPRKSARSWPASTAPLAPPPRA